MIENLPPEILQAISLIGQAIFIYLCLTACAKLLHGFGLRRCYTVRFPHSAEILRELTKIRMAYDEMLKMRKEEKRLEEQQE